MKAMTSEPSKPYSTELNFTPQSYRSTKLKKYCFSGGGHKLPHSRGIRRRSQSSAAAASNFM